MEVTTVIPSDVNNPNNGCVAKLAIIMKRIGPKAETTYVVIFLTCFPFPYSVTTAQMIMQHIVKELQQKTTNINECILATL